MEKLAKWVKMIRMLRFHLFRNQKEKNRIDEIRIEEKCLVFYQRSFCDELCGSHV